MKRVLLITGGSRGIGAATIERFAQVGFDGINLSRSPSAQAVQNLSVDLSDVGDVAALAKPLQDICDSADQICLIHNACAYENDLSYQGTAKDLQRIFQTNLISPILLNTMLIPMMPKGSSILYVGSTLSTKAVGNHCSYVTSKHGLVGLMRSTCQDLFGKGIHTGMVCPGFTDTEMLQSRVGNNQEILDQVSSMSSYNRLVQPKEIAEVLYMMGTQQATNGSLIHVNLGQKEA